MTYPTDSPNLPDSTFSLLRDLIHQRTGAFFDDGKRDTLADKLAPLVAERGLQSFMDYYYLLKYDEEAEVEWQRVQNALAVNETYFWREFDQIRAAAQVLVPQMQRERPGQPVRIWHAACSSGEEPYTMVMALMENGCYIHGPIEIIATDFDSEALAHARAAVYRERSFRATPPEIQQRYFSLTLDGHYRLANSVRERVQFAHLNLVDEAAMRRMRNFDIIFCRNVFIYFSDDVTRRVAEYLYEALNTPGYLFVAASESLLRITTLYELVEVGGAFAYKK